MSSKMKRTSLVLYLAAALVLLALLGGAVYIVSETNQVVITQFGEPVGGTIVRPGLHLKIPFIQKANYFEKRWISWNGDPNQIPTRDKKYIWVDTYCRWRIADPLVFFQRVDNERNARSRLDDIVDGETRNTIAKFNRAFEISEDAAVLDASEAISKIEAGRDKLAAIILENASKITPQFGVDLKDVRIKRVNYVDEVQRKVFDRMIAERRRIAAMYRSEGDGKSAEIRGQKERELKRIQSEAYKTAQEIKGKADAEATRIYAAAYNLDPELYQFMKSLDTYRAGLIKDTWLILTTDSELLKYLKNPGK